VRRANFYGIDERNVTHYGQTSRTTSSARSSIGSRQQPIPRAARREIARWKREPIVKRGIALTPVKFGISFTATMFNQAGALVHVYTDGTVLLNHGGTEMGQGLFTKVAQVVAR
jgi:xanthine dehydrogenase large subunit